MTSYQRRKRDIAYYKQCVKELERLAMHLGETIVKNGGEVKIMLGSGLSGNQFITPYNNGEFDFELLMAVQQMRKGK